MVKPLIEASKSMGSGPPHEVYLACESKDTGAILKVF